MGILQDEKGVPESIPKVALVSAPYDHDITGGKVQEKDCDILVRAISDSQTHHAVPIAVAMALTVAAQSGGSVVH